MVESNSRRSSDNYPNVVLAILKWDPNVRLGYVRLCSTTFDQSERTFG